MGRSPKDGRFAAPPEAIDSLKEFGFNLLALSSNHVLDFKVPGIQDTLESINRLGPALCAGLGTNCRKKGAGLSEDTQGYGRPHSRLHIRWDSCGVVGYRKPGTGGRK